VIHNTNGHPIFSVGIESLSKGLTAKVLFGGNLEKTAEGLSLSISRLRYRVHKVEEILQVDIRNLVVSCQLLLAIQGLILLGDLDINNILDR
jgi:PucR family transcriptional regulator, purine catabolism regulatory protein